jgi:capsular polysaccharide export protein
MIAVTERKIKRLPGLGVLLGEPLQMFSPLNKPEKMAGWGAKRSGRWAEIIARYLGVPNWHLEDGFLRSYGTGDQFPPLSIVVDELGIYYDATRPSSLERLLNSDKNVLEGLAEDIQRAKQLILDHQLSKYNHAPPCDESIFLSSHQRRVLVIDQTADDLSIRLGMASEKIFHDMLNAALQENPDAQIYVKTHPEVSSGRKRGHFSPENSSSIEKNSRIVWLTEAMNPLSVLKHMDAIYVATSQMGFEALLLGKPVYCFGMPWYAGWGVTQDRQSCSRRTRRRNIDELFTAAYFHYTRYINPADGTRGNIFHVIDWLLHQQQMEARWTGRIIAMGFRGWKAENLRSMLTLQPQRLHFVSTRKEAEELNLCHGDVVLHWGNTLPPEAESLARSHHLNVYRMEDGFYRSVGLGSDLIAPNSLVIDRRGIYFDPGKESDLEYLLNNRRFTETDRQRARAIREYIVQHRLTKYNIDPVETPAWAKQHPLVVLVPGQVEDDASIRFGCENVNTNLALLKAAREMHPQAFIVYKPHPDIASGNRRGRMSINAARQYADVIETQCSIISCLEACDEVHTMTSLSGFEALLQGKRVIVYGKPFYAGWGLTDDKVAMPRRKRSLALDELVAGTLVQYPFYWDDCFHGYTQCEAILQRLCQQRDALRASGELEKLHSGNLRRLLRKTKSFPAYKKVRKLFQSPGDFMRESQSDVLRRLARRIR